MKRVMIVTNSLTGGGAERSLNLVANELTARGWTIALVPINSGPSDLVNPICEVFGLERKWQGGLLETLRATRKFNKVVGSWDPEIIVLNCDLPELFGAFLYSTRILVAVEHINRPWAGRIQLGKFVRYMLKKRNVTWVAVSSHLTIWPNEQVPQAVLLNSISFCSVPAIEKNQSANLETINRLIFIGRLAPQKRPNWLIEIGRQTQLSVEFIGEGSMRETLQLDAEISGVSAHFHGQILEPWSLFAKGDVLIVPSEYEGDGLVVIEGLRLGLPILVADIPDFRRFGFPENNYCKTQLDFSERLNRFSSNILDLIVPVAIASQILDGRSATSVGDSWEKFLSSLHREND